MTVYPEQVNEPKPGDVVVIKFAKPGPDDLPKSYGVYALVTEVTDTTMQVRFHTGVTMTFPHRQEPGHRTWAMLTARAELSLSEPHGRADAQI